MLVFFLTKSEVPDFLKKNLIHKTDLQDLIYLIKRFFLDNKFFLWSTMISFIIKCIFDNRSTNKLWNLTI